MTDAVKKAILGLHSKLQKSVLIKTLYFGVELDQMDSIILARAKIVRDIF